MEGDLVEFVVVPHLDEHSLVVVAERILVDPLIGGGGDHTVLVDQSTPQSSGADVPASLHLGDVGVVLGPVGAVQEVGGLGEEMTIDLGLLVGSRPRDELLSPLLLVGDGVGVPSDTGLEVDHLGGDIDKLVSVVVPLLPLLDVGLANNLAGDAGDHSTFIVGVHDHILGVHVLYLDSPLQRPRYDSTSVIGDDFLPVGDDFLFHISWGLGFDDTQELGLCIDTVVVLLDVPVDGVTDLLGIADATSGLLGDEIGLQGADRLADGTVLLLVLEGDRTLLHQVSEGFIGDGLDSAHVSVFF